MRNRSSKRPTESNELARAIVDEATGNTPEVEEIPSPKTPQKNPAAVELGKLGGRKGGPARAAKLTPEQRREIARRAAAARWGTTE